MYFRNMTHVLLASSGTVYLPLLMSNDSLIMSQVQDRILSTFLHHLSHLLWISSRTVYFSLFSSYDSLIMSQLEDRILSTFYIIWLIDYESAPWPYTFRFYVIWLIDYPGPYTFKFRGLHTFADRIVSVNRPYTSSSRTVYFHFEDLGQSWVPCSAMVYCQD